MVDQLELLAAMVSFGALVGFLMLHISVVAHFIVRQKSRNWIRHLVVPVIGFAVAAYVLINAQLDAMIAGAVWMAVGFVLFVGLKMAGRETPLPVNNETSP
jgi:amino acid transporter